MNKIRGNVVGTSMSPESIAARIGGNTGTATEVTEIFGTELPFDEYATGATGNNVRFPINATKTEGKLKSITMKLTGNGDVTIYLCRYDSSGLSFITKFPVVGVYGIKEYINGVDFTYDDLLPVGTIVGMTSGADAPALYYGGTEGSLNVQASVAEGQNNSVTPAAYGVSVYATIAYTVNPVDTLAEDIANLQADVLDIKTKPTPYLIDHNFVDGFGDFTATNWTTSTNGVQNTAAGWDSQLFRTIRTDFDSRGMSVRFIPKSADALLAIGNKNASNLSASTFYGVDFGTKNLALYLNWNNNTSSPVTPITQACGLTLAAGREYVLEYRRHTLVRGKVILRDCLTGESEYFESNTNGLKGWDNPCVIVPVGTVEVKSVKYFHTMPTETKFAVYGDSFIEGANLGYRNIDKRYVQLIADAIGEDIFIDSRGGEGSSGVLQKYPTDSLCKAQYTLIAAGTNDYDYDAWLSNIQNIIGLVEAKGSVPILATVSRRTDSDNLSFIQQANAWVRSSGYAYLDIAKAISLNNDGETINSELYYTDNVHPNVEGHQAIFDRSLIDLPFLYVMTKDVGLDDGYRHIYTHVQTSDLPATHQVDIDKDSGGNTFECSDFMLFLTLPTSDEINTESRTQFYIGRTPSWSDWLVLFRQAFSKSVQRKWRIHMRHWKDGWWITDGVMSEDSADYAVRDTTGSCWLGNMKSQKQFAATMDRLTFYTNPEMPLNTIIEIYGK